MPGQTRLRTWEVSPLKTKALLSNALISLGLGLLLAAVVTVAYGVYSQYQSERAYALEEERETASVAAPATAAKGAVSPQPEAAESSDYTQGGAPTAAPGVSVQARRLLIPAIGVNTRVVEAAVKNGEWQVPKFVAGHLEGTAQPGAGRNVVIAGHVQSISSGNVFARLGELEPGDRVLLVTTAGEEREYVVRRLRTVRANDTSVVQPGRSETLTLVTCTGTFNPITRDYSHRLIAVAEPVTPAPIP